MYLNCVYHFSGFLKEIITQIWQYEQYKDKVSNIYNPFLN